jgi:hypothetical protein
LRARHAVKLGGSLTVLPAVLALCFGRGPYHAVITNETATPDLRGDSVECGEQSPSKQPPLESIKRLMLYLPIESKEASYEVALLGNTPDEIDIRGGLG